MKLDEFWNWKNNKLKTFESWGGYEENFDCDFRKLEKTELNYWIDDDDDDDIVLADLNEMNRGGWAKRDIVDDHWVSLEIVAYTIW